MNNLGKWIAVLLVLAAAGLAALAWWLGSRPAPVMAKPVAAIAVATVQYPAVVAAVKLEQGKPITAADVSLLNLPASAPGTYQNTAAVIGKVPTTDIAAGALVMETGIRHGLALALEPGERAVAVAVDEVIGAGNRIEPGDYVDVFFTLRQGTDIEKSQARLLVSRQRVLAYGTTVVGEQGTDNSKQTTTTPPRTAVLAIPVNQVNDLLLAAHNGRLVLALRSPADQQTADASLFANPTPLLNVKGGLTRAQQEALNTPENQAFAGVDLPSWAVDSKLGRARSSPRINSPMRSSAPRSTIEVIRGTQREAVPF